MSQQENKCALKCLLICVHLDCTHKVGYRILIIHTVTLKEVVRYLNDFFFIKVIGRIISVI